MEYIKNCAVIVNMIKESDIRDFNPWWKDLNKIYEDEKIINWKDSTINFIPRLKHKITWDFLSDNTVIYTLRGPRQVGKTTMIKIQIKDFLEKGIAPWNILYYSLDLASTKQDIVDVIEKYMKITSRHRGNRRNYLFLDEVSSVYDWQKGIKWLVDQKKLTNSTVMVTGSEAIDIKNATERLPNRKGRIDDNHDKVLLPMKFSEFASLNEDIKDIISDFGLLTFDERKNIFMRLVNNEIDERIDKLNAYQNELNDLLKEYMLAGGTPQVINEKFATSLISERTYTNYLEGITGEWNKLGKNETLLKQFGAVIIKSLTSHISWTNLSKEAALGNPNTASDYALTLQDLFVLSIIHLYGTDKRIPMIQKDRKFYFQDPFFLHIFNGWINTKDSFESSLKYTESEENRSKIIEGITADHLIRLAFSLSKKKQTFEYSSHVFYWKDDKNKEVDFIFYDGDSIEVPIEVKFRNRINYKELSGLTNFLSKTGRESGIVLSKSDLDIKTDYTIIPASVFLLLI